MLRHSLYKIIQEERRRLIERIADEERGSNPDPRRLGKLRAQASDLRREMEWFPEAREAGGPESVVRH